MDLIRGGLLLIIGILLFLHKIKLWIIFSMCAVLGSCTAFFNPCVRSILPDIVPRTRLMKSNAIFNISYVVSRIMGMSTGGYFFILLGAPLLFMFNGLSYILSAFHSPLRSA